MNAYDAKILQELDRLIDESISDAEVELGNGMAEDHNDYSKRVGRISGMKDVLEMIDNLKKKFGEL